MKTLAELKRIAKANTHEAKMVYRFGEEIPEKLSGWRWIVDSNSVSISLLNNDNKKSELRIDAAALIEYDGSSITLYNAGLRELNAEEKDAMDGWQKIADTEQYKQQAEIDALTDGSGTYWQERAYFEKSGYGYLFHSDDAARHYDHNTGKIRDKQVKGDKIIQYEIRQRQN